MKFEGTKQLPSLDFDEDIGRIRISGVSIALSSVNFWEPLIEKMETYLEDPRDISLEINLDHFNTPAARQILRLLTLIATKTQESNRRFAVIWHDNDDEDMREAGEDYQSMIDKNILWRFES